MDHIYVVIDRSLHRQPEAMKGDRSQRDVKRNYALHIDIRHNTKRCVALKDEIERLIKAGHFKEFIDEPHMANKEEQPQQRSPEKIKEVLTIFGRSHLAGESHSALDKYTRKLKLLHKYKCIGLRSNLLSTRGKN